MRVKRYVVDSMPDAMQRIRSDLGKDAVILNTKEIRSGGFLGLFSRRQIEVIAAIDSAHSQQSGPALTHSKINAPKDALDPNITTKSQLGSISEAQASASSHTSATAVMDKKPGEVKVKQPTGHADSHDDEQNSDRISEELKQMKKMIYSLMNQNPEHNQSLEIFENIEKKLMDHEFDPLLIQEIFHRTIEQSESPVEEWSEKDTYRQVKEQLRIMVQPDQIQVIADETKFVHFVGPTGVGKTTSIAKLAAEQVLKHHKKVGFITSDTYRIAAVEQLRTYATILNVPLEVVYSPQDLNKALDVLKDRDIIFMDTAGRNFRNEMYVSELNSLLKTHENSETFLVLSLTMKYKDMKAVTHNFSKFKLDKILFTKQDETESYGNIFNILHDFSLQLSYITNGQNVPDDITKINIDKLIDHILEEDRDE